MNSDAAILPDAVLEQFARALTATIQKQYPQSAAPPIAFEAPRRPEFGDFATNVAFSLAKDARAAPQAVALILIERTLGENAELHPLFDSIQAVAGFINVRLAPRCWQSSIARILREREQFGQGPPKQTRVSLEFGSANPTGPLVVVQGRTMSIGQTLANVMQFCGFDVFNEWIINDQGAQMDTLGRSLYARYRQIFEPSYAFPEDGYPAEYLLPIAAEIAQRDGAAWSAKDESEWLPVFSAAGRERIVREQQAVAERFGIHYDLWQSEKQLHDSGRVREDLQRLTDLGHTYESEGALFFKATDFGDDKDRVIVRSDGRPTYYGGDIAYHYEKLKRADRVIDILGPDHHGYIGRLKGLAEALGFPGRLEVVISQQITLLRGAQEVSMSKRAGNIVSLEDILDEVGVDAARFFFIMLAPDSPLKFDLALAKEQSNNNPVFYVQYGHARICSVFKNASPDDLTRANGGDAALQRLTEPSEMALARRLAELPRLLANVVEQFAPHRLTHYARDVASDFHQFYTDCKILVEDAELRTARLALCLATKSVLATTLRLAGVSAPETM